MANDILHWVKIFLNAIIDTADDGKKPFLLIMELKKETDSFTINLGGRAENANKILELFYQKPALNVKGIEKSLSMNQSTIRNLLNTLERENFIIEYTGNKRNKKYIFQRYFNCFTDLFTVIAITFQNFAFAADHSKPLLITVNGDAEVRVVPDEVILTLGVGTWNKDLNIVRNLICYHPIAID